MKTTWPVLLLCLALAVAGCGDDDSSESGTTQSPQRASGAEAANRTKPQVAAPQGAAPSQLVEEDLIEGTGAAAKAGDEVTVQYVGVDYETGKEFDASWDRGEPFSFQLGGGEVIGGWDQGIEGMKVGGRRELTIPPNLAYGPAGAPPAIAPNATLVFVVDLLGVN